MKSLQTAPPTLLRAALCAYPKSLPENPKIDSLETFLNTLRAAIPTRKPPHITSTEYSKLISWKLTRGKWRPRLQRFADDVTDDIIVPTSGEAFEHYKKGRTKDALKKLTRIKGCGPASASLVLALVGACFMGDEVLEAVLGQRKYTEKAFLELQDAVEDKCNEMGDGWDAWDVERAVYAAVKLGMKEGERRGREKGDGKGETEVKSDGKAEKTTEEGEPHDGCVKPVRRSKRIRRNE